MTALVYALLLALPGLQAALLLASLDTFAVVYEAAFEIFTLGWFAWCRHRGIRIAAPLWVLWACLLAADLIYNLAILTSTRLGGATVIGSYTYALGFGALSFAIWRRYLSPPSEPTSTRSFLMIAALACSAFALQYMYVLIPQDAMGVFSLAARLAYYTYSLVTSILTACTVLASLRTMDMREHAFLQGLHLLLLSDFAIRYTTSMRFYNGIALAEAGWATAIGIMALATWSASRRGGVCTAPAALGEWASVRTACGIFMFAANLTVLCGLLVFNLFYAQEAVQFSATLLLIWACWGASNLLGLKISTELQSVRRLMPDYRGVPNRLENLAAVAMQPIPQSRMLAEIRSMAVAYNSVIEQSSRAFAGALVASRQASLGQQAAQVAHDIRSPLAALDMLARDMHDCEEDQRILLRSAVARIRDIAQALLAKNKGIDPARGPQRLHVFGLLHALVAEKRLQYRDMAGIVIDTLFVSDEIAAFVDAHEADIKRVISNLINNAIEALGDHGRVEIVLQQGPKHVVIEIRDDGPGMPEQALRAFEAGTLASSKASGHGLGLKHAQEAVAVAGGELTLSSPPNAGCTCRITLPRQPAPVWFVDVLQVDVDHVAILDDDPTIHGLWRDRMSKSAPTARLHHLANAAELRARVAARGATNTLFLLDHDLRGSAETGLNLIGELRLSQRTVLVTSHFEDPAIQKQCVIHGVGLISKPMVPYLCVKSVDRPGRRSTHQHLDSAESSP